MRILHSSISALIMILLSIISSMPLGSSYIKPETPPTTIVHTPQLDTFTIGIKSAIIDRDTKSSTLPPRATITITIQLENSGMHEKKDVLLHISLETNQGETAAESSQLVYVPLNQSRTYQINILLRQAGSYLIIAEVSSRGRTTIATPTTISISTIDLFS